MMQNRKYIQISILLLLFFAVIYSEAPQLIKYQGILSPNLKGNHRPDRKHLILFEIFPSSSGGSPIWSQTKQLLVFKGMYRTILVPKDLMNLPLSQQYWLSISYNSKVLYPRIRLTGIFHFIRANNTNFSIATNESKDDDKLINNKLVEIINEQKEMIKTLETDILKLYDEIKGPM